MGMCALSKESIVEEQDEGVSENLLKQWQSTQTEIRKQLVLEDCEQWSLELAKGKDDALQYIAGVDISFVKDDEHNACAALVVISFPNLQVVYEDISMVTMTVPYVPGYLAFRESELLEEKLRQLKLKQPELFPQVILIDGNGILHPKGCGLACHLGVNMDIASIGVAKNLYHIDGLNRDSEYHSQVSKLLNAGDTFPLVGDSGRTLGMALKSCSGSSKPVYVSVGHKISLQTAVSIISRCCKHRVPEPVRQADLRSRQYLRDNWIVK